MKKNAKHEGSKIPNHCEPKTNWEVQLRDDTKKIKWT